MPYIDAATTKKIRNALKTDERLKGMKFSVRKDGFIAVRVTIKKCAAFEGSGITQINHFHIKNSKNLNEEQKKIALAINDVIVTAGDYKEDSDSMIDYFNDSFYYHIESEVE